MPRQSVKTEVPNEDGSLSASFVAMHAYFAGIVDSSILGGWTTTLQSSLFPAEQQQQQSKQ
jgi:hypothetical protein